MLFPYERRICATSRRSISRHSVAVPACLILNKPTQEPREPTVAGSSSAGAFGNGEHSLIAQVVRFARPNIQIYDAHVVDLYQWVCPQKARGTSARGRRL